MKRFKHTNRSGFAFVLFSPFTLFILPWVMLAHARTEVNSMHQGRPDYKKSMPVIVAFLLGIITLFIVPFAWIARLAGKIRRLSAEHNVEGKCVSGTWMVCWLLFGSLIIVGPFVAYMRFFRSLNRLEKKLNEEMDAAEAEAAKEDEQAVMKEEQAVSEGEEKPAEEPGKEENLPAVVEPAKEEKPAECKPAEEPGKEAEPAPEAEPLPPEKRKYRVRMAAKNQPMRYFETKEDAIAYAKGVAKARKVNVIVKK